MASANTKGKAVMPLAYTYSQAADAAHVSRPTLYKWAHMEGFPIARIGGSPRIPVRAFERWLERQAGIEEQEVG